MEVRFVFCGARVDVGIWGLLDLGCVDSALVETGVGLLGRWVNQRTRAYGRGASSWVPSQHTAHVTCGEQVAPAALGNLNANPARAGQCI
eukprot:1687265-Rhodomonas_salina.2